MKTSITQHHSLLVENWINSRCSCESLGFINDTRFRFAALPSNIEGVIGENVN